MKQYFTITSYSFFNPRLGYYDTKHCIVIEYSLNHIKCFRSKRRHSQKLPPHERKLCRNNKIVKSQKVSVLQTGQKTWPCTKCIESFSSDRQLRKHRKEIHKKEIKLNQFSFFYDQSEDIYFCDNCSLKSASRSKMEEHIKTHDPYICLVCNDKFYSLHKFCAHNQIHEPGCFKCPLCDYQTDKKRLIKRHINTAHLNTFTYNCDVCGKGFQVASNYKDHQNTHAGAQAISCVVCQKEFKFRAYLLIHQRRIHTVHVDAAIENQCKICKRILKSDIMLKKHMIQHEPKHHLCDICGKDFKRKDLLRMHFEMHTGIKQYQCSYCTKAFVTRTYLVMHERVHSGEKPFACEYCGKAFNQRTSLKTHIRGHTGERPYVCHICKKGFITRKSLNLHFKTCNG